MARTHLPLAAAVAALCAVGAAGCDSSTGSKDKLFGSAVTDASTPEEHGDAATGQPPWERPAVEALASIKCEPAQTSDHLPARTSAMHRSSSGTAAAGVPVRDLYEQFTAYCVGCHVDQAQGGFQVSWPDFRDADPKRRAALGQKMAKAIERIRADDPAKFMPPPPVGQPFSARGAGDPVVQLAQQLEAWIEADLPMDVFSPSGESVATGDNYFLSKDVGTQMTNLGNCVPSKEGFASEKTRSAALDAMFAEATKLPERLEQTDLFTLDSKALAAYGVVGFAPAYPLWSNDAKKIRYVRVPRGESIAFDKDTQSFSIPPNTRFYKTFLKKVIDKQGRESYRKLETRLIVARPDDESGTDPFGFHRALFGTYVWNEQETEAVLLKDPLRNGKPFRDRMVTFYTNEAKVAKLISDGVLNLEDKLREGNLSRKWAVPGSERCIHCHMGSDSKSFVLGFMPVQMRRRPVGEGGVIDATAADELNQLQRLIDYGVVSGIESEDDVTPLETSQGDRAPRNDHELVAQGYMLGNCAHCHNPRGFPTRSAPELEKMLNFLPSVDGGIFQFPLERYSPRIFRGPDQNIPIPYITPSLYDLPRSEVLGNLYSFPYQYDRTDEFGEPIGTKTVLLDPSVTVGPGNFYPDLAPWRSLIYRNVGSPFSYDDDSTIFPHMPRDTSGFDCRAQQLLGTWMTSIHARLKSGLSSTHVARGGDVRIEQIKFETAAQFPEASYTSPDVYSMAQPYEEAAADFPVPRSTTRAAAAQRVSDFRFKGRYSECPDPDLDIVDPEIEDGQRPLPQREPASSRVPCSVAGGCVAENNILPERPHWFVMDLTDAPSFVWEPRRGDWRSVFQDPDAIPRKGDPRCPSTTCEKKSLSDRRSVHLLTGRDPWGTKPDVEPVRITDRMREFAVTPIPMGVWRDPKGDCNFAGRTPHVRTAADFSGDQRPKWMDRGHETKNGSFGPINPSERIYEISPGAQVFTSICANCHGPRADSFGRMAETVSDLTGGATRVANLRDGFFGPTEAPGRNRAEVFRLAVPHNGPADQATAEDWAARYLLWMGLGGTQRVIPSAVLNVVGNSQVVGTKRRGLGDLKDSGANMLAVADFLCGKTLPLGGAPGGLRFDVASGAVDPVHLQPPKYEPPFDVGSDIEPSLAVMSNNGDAEFWERLCTLDNAPPIRKISFREELNVGRFYLDNLDLTLVDDNGVALGDGSATYAQLYRRSVFPPDWPVGDHRGRLQDTLKSDNLAPWCVERPETAENRERLLARWRASRPNDPRDPPYCPDTFKFDIYKGDPHRFNAAEIRDWTRRGAMNAGLIVFLYLDALTKGQVQPPVAYDRCEELP